MSSPTNLPRAFKPQTCRPVTLVHWRDRKWAARIPADPLRILGNVWIPCIVAMQRCARPSVKAIVTAVKDIGRAAAKIWNNDVNGLRFSIRGDVLRVCTEGPGTLRADTCNKSWSVCVCVCVRVCIGKWRQSRVFMYESMRASLHVSVCVWACDYVNKSGPMTCVYMSSHGLYLTKCCERHICSPSSFSSRPPKRFSW